ncbi:MAG: hypothetical protein AAF907_11680 [Planctomycetota bacterium]
MFRRIASSLFDELAGLGLLYGVMRAGNRPPRRGPISPIGPAALLSGDPAALFGSLPEAAGRFDELTTLPRKEADRVPGCGEALDWAYPSSDQTEFAENQTVHGRLWRSESAGAPRRAVLAVDGLVQGGFGNLRSLASVCCSAGIDLATIDLPCNHRRTPDGYRPGQLILGGDLPHVLSVLRQAVRDTAAALRTLIESGAYPGGVGLAGISFGGWTALQTAALLGSVWGERTASRPRFVCGVCPAADLMRALTAGGPMVRAARRNLQLSQAELNELDAVAASVRPASFPSPFASRPGGPPRILLHAGRYDRFVPNPAIEELTEIWRGELTWHSTGHMGLAASLRFLRRVAKPWTVAELWERSAPPSDL